MRYEIQTFTLFGGWVNDWQENGESETFASYTDALWALDDFFSELYCDYVDGYIDSMPDREDYRIVKVMEAVDHDIQA